MLTWAGRAIQLFLYAGCGLWVPLRVADEGGQAGEAAGAAMRPGGAVSVPRGFGALTAPDLPAILRAKISNQEAVLRTCSVMVGMVVKTRAPRSAAPSTWLLRRAQTLSLRHFFTI